MSAMINPFTPARELGYGRPVKMLVYGLPGTRKTTFALTAMPSKTCVIDMEAGTAWYPDVGDYDVLRTTTLKEVMQALYFLQADNGKTYKTLVIDPITVLWDVLKDGYSKAQGKLAALGAGKIPFNAWAEIKPAMNTIYDILLNLPIHVVIVARAKDDIDTSNGVEVKGLKPDAEKNLESILDIKILMVKDGDEYRAVVEKDRTGFLGKENLVITNLGADHFAPIFQAISQGPTVVTPSVNDGVDSLSDAAFSDASGSSNQQSNVVQYPSAPKPVTAAQHSAIVNWKLGEDAWENGAQLARMGEFSRLSMAKARKAGGNFAPVATTEELNQESADEFIKYLKSISEQFQLFHSTGKSNFGDGWGEVGATIVAQVNPDRSTNQYTYVELKKANELLTLKIADFEAAAGDEPAQPKYVQHNSGLWNDFMAAGMKAYGSKKAWDEARHEFIFEITKDEERKSSLKMTSQEMLRAIAELGKKVMEANNLDEGDLPTRVVEWDDLELYRRILLRKLEQDGPQHYSKLRLFGEGYDTELMDLGLIQTSDKNGYREISEAGKAVLPAIGDEGQFQTFETWWDGFHINIFDPEMGTQVGVRTNTLIKFLKSVAVPDAYVDGGKFEVHYLPKLVEVKYRKEKVGHFLAYDITITADSADKSAQESMF